MSGTRIGGLKAAATNRARHNEDYYHRIGAKGGRASSTGGFYANRELARRAGALGGKKSRRGVAKKTIKTELADFQSGFNQPSWVEKFRARFQ